MRKYIFTIILILQQTFVFAALTAPSPTTSSSSASLTSPTSLPSASSLDLIKVFNAWLARYTASIYTVDPQFSNIQSHNNLRQLANANYKKNYDAIFSQNLLETLTGIKPSYFSSTSAPKTGCMALDRGQQVQKIYDLSIFPLTQPGPPLAPAIFVNSGCTNLWPIIHFHQTLADTMVKRLAAQASNQQVSSRIYQGIFREQDVYNVYNALASQVKKLKYFKLLINSCAYTGPASTCKDNVRSLFTNIKAFVKNTESARNMSLDMFEKYETSMSEKSKKKVVKNFADIAEKVEKAIKSKDEITKQTYDDITTPLVTLESNLTPFYLKQLGTSVMAYSNQAGGAVDAVSPLSISALTRSEGYVKNTDQEKKALKFLSYILNRGGATAKILPDVPLVNTNNDVSDTVITNGKLYTYNQLSVESSGGTQLIQIKANRPTDLLSFQSKKAEYQKSLRASSATKNIAISNFYDMYARRLRPTASADSGKLASPNWRMDPSSEWVKDMNKATPVVLERHAVYLLAEMKKELIDSNRILERLLATLSMQFIQADEGSESSKSLSKSSDEIGSLYSKLATGKMSTVSSAGSSAGSDVAGASDVGNLKDNAKSQVG
jgi:hypothetical protein